METGISDRPLQVADAVAAVTRPECGGIGVFVGAVRTSSTEAEGRTVLRLEYEAHPTLAAERLREIRDEAIEIWGLGAAVVVHRTGACEVGEPTVVVACAAPHRAEALDACRYIIDAIKRTVPIWKREVYSDGSAWVGADHSHADAGT